VKLEAVGLSVAVSGAGMSVVVSVVDVRVAVVKMCWNG
jgi:hypothetical protein